MSTLARLLIWCPDRRGIIAATTGFLADVGINVLEADQHTDPDDGTFCMRLEFDTDGMKLSRDELSGRWGELAQRFKMDWRIAWAAQRKRIAILVSKQDHCLQDLLWRTAIGELDGLLGPLWDRALAAERESLTLATLRDTLLPKLMSGEVRMREAEEVVEDVL